MSDPVQAEAAGDETVEWTWRGEVFNLPATSDDWDLDVLAAFEDGKSVAAVRGVLGDSQYARLRRKCKPKVRDLGSIMDSLAVIYGFASAGESGASSDS